jgi:hypothetical protein
MASSFFVSDFFIIDIKLLPVLIQSAIDALCILYSGEAMFDDKGSRYLTFQNSNITECQPILKTFLSNDSLVTTQQLTQPDGNQSLFSLQSFLIP